MGSRLIKVQEKGQKRKDIRQEAAGRLQLAEDKKRWRAFGQLSACPVEYEVHSTGVVRCPLRTKNKARSQESEARRKEVIIEFLSTTDHRIHWLGIAYCEMRNFLPMLHALCSLLLTDSVLLEAIEQSVSGDSQELGRLYLVLVGLLVGSANGLLDHIIKGDTRRGYLRG